MATTSKKTTATEKKPLAKKSVATTPAVKKTATAAKKTAGTPAKKVSAAKTEKTPAPKASSKKAAQPAASKAATAGKSVKKQAVTPEERYHMIATAAYFLAERRGFSGGYEMQDWITAEADIDAMLRAGD